MTPHKQLFRHRPAKGLFGDCYRTAIACLLDLQPAEVPHFYDGCHNGPSPPEVEAAKRAWFASRGIYEVSVPYEGEREAVLRAFSLVNPSLHFMFSGTSKTGCNHTVIARDGAIVHDPALDAAGIVGPCDDGLYWIGFLARPT